MFWVLCKTSWPLNQESRTMHQSGNKRLKQKTVRTSYNTLLQRSQGWHSVKRFTQVGHWVKRFYTGWARSQNLSSDTAPAQILHFSRISGMWLQLRPRHLVHAKTHPLVMYKLENLSSCHCYMAWLASVNSLHLKSKSSLSFSSHLDDSCICFARGLAGSQ